MRLMNDCRGACCCLVDVGGCHIGGELPQGNRTKRNVSMSPAAMHPGANEMLQGGQEWRDCLDLISFICCSSPERE